MDPFDKFNKLDLKGEELPKRGSRGSEGEGEWLGEKVGMKFEGVFRKCCGHFRHGITELPDVRRPKNGGRKPGDRRKGWKSGLKRECYARIN